MATIHLGDIGTVLEVTIKDADTKQVIDISTAITKEIKLRTPSGVTKIKTAIFKTDGTDGIVKYITEANDLDEYGAWELQAYIVSPLFTNHSSIDTFIVSGNL